MEENELSALARSLHARFGKKFHTEKEALDLIRPYWLENNEISAAVLFGIAAYGAGKKKPHASGIGDSGRLKPVSKNGRKKSGFRIK